MTTYYLQLLQKWFLLYPSRQQGRALDSRIQTTVLVNLWRLFFYLYIPLNELSVVIMQCHSVYITRTVFVADWCTCWKIWLFSSVCVSSLWKLCIKKVVEVCLSHPKYYMLVTEKKKHLKMQSQNWATLKTLIWWSVEINGSQLVSQGLNLTLGHFLYNFLQETLSIFNLMVLYMYFPSYYVVMFWFTDFFQSWFTL